jgi:hypothetical protein
MRVRLGDDLDDFCVKCKRIMNHLVVSLLNDEPAKVRCRTCHGDHDFRHEQAPPPKTDARKLAQQALGKTVGDATIELAEVDLTEAELADGELAEAELAEVGLTEAGLTEAGLTEVEPELAAAGTAAGAETESRPAAVKPARKSGKAR